jgi:hypothetical protein
LPGLKTWGSDVDAAESEQAQEDDCSAVHEDCERASEEKLRRATDKNGKHTPISRPLHLLSACVEHRCDLQRCALVI